MSLLLRSCFLQVSAFTCRPAIGARWLASTATAGQSALKKKEESNKKNKKKEEEEKGEEADERMLEAIAYATSDTYDLSLAKSNLRKDYTICRVPEVTDALVIDLTDKQKQQQQSPSSPSRVFVFDVGVIVFWNVDLSGRQDLLRRLDDSPITGSSRIGLEGEEVENESMDYRIDAECKKSRIGPKGDIILCPDPDPLHQYSISHAMSLSVKLATYESSLVSFADSVQWVAESMAAGQKLTLTRTEVFQKVGQLFKLRHDINLGVDLLDTPDFYWDREELETLFRSTCSSLSVSKRTKLLNERLSYCYELMELLTSHLNEEHGSKLEWMIIWLITIEVGFEIIHFVDKFYFPASSGH